MARVVQRRGNLPLLSFSVAKDYPADGAAMRLLALDLATQTGWCLRRGESIDAGTVSFAPKKFEGGGMRNVRFRDWLAEMLPRCDQVAFEAVRRHMGVDAAHIYGAFSGILQEECERRSIPYLGVSVQAIKKQATGKGNAKKDAMVAAAVEKWPGVQIADDNQADAMWLSEVVLSGAA